MSGPVWHAAIAEVHKHRRLTTSSRGERMLTAVELASRPIAVPAGHAVLTTTGRTSRQPRQTVLRVARCGSTAYAAMLRRPEVAIDRPDLVSGWVHNIRANPRVDLRIGRTTYSGVAREIADPAELRQARDALCDPVHPVDYAESLIHLRGRPSRRKVKQLHRYWFDTGIPVAIDLSPAEQ